jgi:hypothetical protein
MSALVPAEAPRSVKLVGAHKFIQDGVSSLNTTFEYEFPSKWLVANVAIQEKSGVKSIIGFNVYQRSQSLEDEHRFTLAGKQAPQYFGLAGAIAVFAISLYALVACARTKQLHKKWLWILFILAGFGKFAVNWTTGEWGFSPLFVQLFSASAVAPLYGPWVVGFSIPIGAIVFLIYARRRAQPETAS